MDRIKGSMAVHKPITEAFIMSGFELPPLMLMFLFGGGLFAGFVDSIAGGGGLISLPILLSAGLPPQLALGTNKLQGTFGTFSSAFNYIRNGKANLNQLVVGIIFTLIGAILGAWVIQQLEPDFLRPVIPVLLTLVFFYTLFSPRLGIAPRLATISEPLFFIMSGLVLGFYDGFFGPGTGSFWTAVLMIFLGYDMTKAAGSTRVLNLTSNLVALCMFVFGANVLYSAGLCMAAGQVIGAQMGSTLAIKNGAAVIRPFFLTVVFLTTMRLVYLYVVAP